ncbi:MCE family protein, partial [Francisella tularensis subsp. holarctica]|nr:MCE family protein [Francisella tularensis subsp. holarctica]
TMNEFKVNITSLNNFFRILEYDPSIIVRGVDHKE